MKSQRGITLIEVMVALAITAVALMAASQAMRALINGSERQQQVVLAQLCAENALVGAKLGRQYPVIGQHPSTCVQAGQTFDVTLHVSGTANPSFRRVQAQVLQAGNSILSVTTVIGRY